MSRKLSAVMLCPNATSPGSQPRNAAGPLVRGRDELVGALRGGVRRADVRVVVAQVARDGVDHLVGALRPARAVEEREPPVERRETPP